MSARSNAIAELTRFWLQARHGCLVDEGLPVPVPYALSDIDLVSLRADLTPFALPDGLAIGPRVIVETKDEHDWEPTGGEFGALLRADVQKMADGKFVPSGEKGVKFTMLRQEHYEKAAEFFGTDDFDRLFVVHAIDPAVRAELAQTLADRRIRWVTIVEVVEDLQGWYRAHPRKAGLCHTLVGDLWHLLVGFCNFQKPSHR